MLGHFVESYTRLYRIYIPNTKKIIIVQKDDFKQVKTNPRPGVSALLDRISRQLEEEEEEKQRSIKTLEQQLINAFAAVSINQPLIAYTGTKKKKKHDPNVPSSFGKPFEYPGWDEAIAREQCIGQPKYMAICSAHF